MTGETTAGPPGSGRQAQHAHGRAPNAALVGHYRVRDVEHDVYVVRLWSLRWQVLDVTETDVAIVDTLRGFDDHFEQARALASDYLREQRAHHPGRREDDPPPPPSSTAAPDAS